MPELEVNPLASPPVTIGEITDTPAPGSPISAQWAQEITYRVVQRWPNKAALDTWAAQPGALAVTVDTGVTYLRTAAGGWARQTPWGGQATGQATSPVARVDVPYDPGSRYLSATWYVAWTANTITSGAVALGLFIDGAEAAEFGVDAVTHEKAMTLTIASFLVGPGAHNVTAEVHLQGAIGAITIVTGNPVFNRLSVLATAGGF